MNITTRYNNGVVDALVDGNVVGKATIDVWSEVTGVNLYRISVDVEVDFICTPIMPTLWDAAEQQIQHDAKGREGANLYGGNVTSLHPEFADFLIDRGYSQHFSVVDMELDLDTFEYEEIALAYVVDTASPDEAMQIADLMMDSYGNREFIRTMNDDDRKKFCDELSEENSFTYVARDNGQIIGFVWARILEDSCEIGQVSVDPHYHKLGIGRSLMITTLNELKRRGQKRVTLDTRAEDVSGARSLYSYLGFEVCKTHYLYRKPIPME